MARISFYLDEHVQICLAAALRARGVDVLTTQEAGNIGLEDTLQVDFASEKNQSILTYNKRDFAKIHYDWMGCERPHAGIILSDQLAVGIFADL